MGTDTTDVNRLESEENAIHTDAYAAQVRSNVNRFVCSITANFEYQNKLFVLCICMYLTLTMNLVVVKKISNGVPTEINK